MYQYLLIKAILITNPANYHAPSYNATTFKLFQSKQACYERLLVMKENFEKSSPENVELIVDNDEYNSDVLILKMPVSARINYYTCQKVLIEEIKE